MDSRFMRRAAVGPGDGEARYRISKAGIAGLWGLVEDERRLGVEERVSLALALNELERERTGCRQPARRD